MFLEISLGSELAPIVGVEPVFDASLDEQHEKGMCENICCGRQNRRSTFCP
jgi:hypothetical protein